MAYRIVVVNHQSRKTLYFRRPQRQVRRQADRRLSQNRIRHDRMEAGFFGTGAVAMNQPPVRQGLSLEVKLRLVQDYEDGFSVQQVADMHGLKHSTVNRILKSMGVRMRSPTECAALQDRDDTNCWLPTEQDIAQRRDAIKATWTEEECERRAIGCDTSPVEVHVCTVHSNRHHRLA